ncbi:Queuine tRNA-ribosyltransferase accessory subunit 2 [Colletotrichum orbiculare MAFF 240422]|uniref:Queuine tRNA-ribosyltransferase accessory subunit 2 n=1 Tax=Colletotrichum orbiculare (strain 104-T / ATCC 96160 / CBS 514.97 / LARS 414 / MAFF 240422) TaxID=1213857 RepID=N4V5R7_COLOR|nr:Queuine tRNA-ribosyltransferase accessory subunit 2 [Colletotrichum orbiculare MAFF 240422]
MTVAGTTNGESTQDGMRFEILKKAADGAASARVGRLTLSRRKPIETPNFIATASRGVIPHITPDNLAKHARFGAAYMALEDFIERKTPPILSMPSSPDKRRIDAFTCFPDTIATVLAARRNPAIKTPVGNGSKFMAIFTSTGFRNLTIDEYCSAVHTLRPDMAVGPADLFHTSTMPPSKKLVRMAERTDEWADVFLSPKNREALRQAEVAVFAPVLAVPYHIQWEYLNHLSMDVVDALGGLALYDVDLLPDIVENYKPLVALPRLSLHIPDTPQAVLRQISLGVDVCSVPFVNTVSDSGVALTFSFPAPHNDGVRPLGVDMWLPEHEAALEPLSPGCGCYACTTHHRAFVHHLLNAKEMLGWTLLQIHNHQVLTDFFAGVRAALEVGVEHFEEQVGKFAAAYEPELPQGTGTRPRARGYHFKGEANPSRINPPAWENFSDVGSDAGRAATAGGEGQGQETPLVPDVGSLELEDKGFAEVDEKSELRR